MVLEDDLLEAEDPDFEFNLKWTANSMYSASGDTVSYFILLFMLRLHPLSADYHYAVSLSVSNDGEPRSLQESSAGN